MDIQQINENLYRIPIPVPFPMKYVYCYLLRGREGWDLIDTGLTYAAAQEAWKAAFANLSLDPRDVRAIYLTHFHPDHVGLAGWMQQWTGAPVWISREDMQMVHRVWGQDSQQSKHMGEMFRKNGMPVALTEQIVANMDILTKSVQPLAEMSPFNDEDVVLGDEQWKAIPTPGHSDGHLCFYQPQKRLLISADHIMEKITPNISLWPGCRPNPLQDYLESLEKMRELDVDLALPGHGGVITRFSDRIGEIIQHHEERVEKMYTLAQGGRTAYQVAEAVFREKELTPHQWRFAMAETLAHLEFLAAQGRLLKREETEIVYDAAGDAASRTALSP